jgi:hypothetical protein
MKTDYLNNPDWTKFINYPFYFYGEDLVEEGSSRYYKWSGTDNSHQFNRVDELGEYKDLVRHYKDNPIRYYVNKQNYRTSFEFDEKYDGEVDIALGCSNTFGLGMHNDLIWPTLVSNHTNVPIINLGMAGLGPDHSYIALNKVIDKYKVRKIFHHHQIFGRHLYLGPQEGGTYKFLCMAYNQGYGPQAQYIYKEDYFKDVMMEEGYLLFEHKRAVDAISGMCSQRDINYYYYNTQPYHLYNKVEGDILVGGQYKINRVRDIPEDDLLARDIFHPSKHQHKIIADRFIEVGNKDGYIEPFLDNWKNHMI